MVFATVGFFALTIFGLGAVSVLTGGDTVEVPGLGRAPGIVGMVASVVVFALALGVTLRGARPSFVRSITIALLTTLAHLLAVWVTVAVGAGSLVIGTAVAGDLVRGGASAVVLGAAAIAAWGGIALRRTRSARPRWPWERDDDGE